MLAVVLASGFVVAVDSSDILVDAEEEFGDVEFDAEAGLTPDSAFYFLDGIFGDDLDEREEKVAEILQMIDEGKLEEAREALEQYQEFAGRVEREVAPEDEERARRGAVGIKRALEQIEGKLSDEDQREFVTSVLERERGVATAAAVAGKIKALCEELADLDPSQYARVCKTGDDAPKWQKDLDRDLTEDQQKKAKKFFKTMKQCFDDPEECACEEIEIKPFADKCSVIAPLAAKCDSGNENACEEMDEYERENDPFDDLPDYLRDVLDELEGKYDHDRMGNFMPPECEKEGADSPEACMKIMFAIHAPEECQNALERGEIDTSNERKAREQCEEIMFRDNAPEECIDAGLMDHEECGLLMFEKHAPEECIDAGLDGSSKGDHRECEKMMRGRGHEGPRDGPRGPGPDCRRIEDAEERLDCYDGKLEHYEGERKEFDYSRGEPVGGWPDDWPEECKKAQAFEKGACEKHMRDLGEWEKRDAEEKGRWEEDDNNRRAEEKICAEKCRAEGRPWDYYGGECVCKDEKFEDHGPGPDFGRPDDRRGEDDYGESQCKDGCSQECPGASRTDCVDGGMRCACYYEGPEDDFDDGGDGRSSDDGQDSGLSPPSGDDGNSGSSDGGEDTSGDSDGGERF